jgi:nucleoside-diphosphate-sugar epimerase
VDCSSFAPGASGIIHVANDMTGSSDSHAISLAVSGALNALKAATKAGIKRFVYTSSSFAVTQPKPNEVFEITEDTFNEEAVEKVRKGTANGEDVYCASKVEAERALTSWGKEHAPEVVINMGTYDGSNRSDIPDSSESGHWLCVNCRSQAL